MLKQFIQDVASVYYLIMVCLMQGTKLRGKFIARRDWMNYLPQLTNLQIRQFKLK